MNFDIRLLENSDVIPESNHYPHTPWINGVSHGDKYNLAFEIDESEGADTYLAMLIGHRLRYWKTDVFEKERFVCTRPLKWSEAFKAEREELAWLALAKDIGDFELYQRIDGKLIERTLHRDHVWTFYKAQLPERVRKGKQADILERVHIEREKKARNRGESYWRKVHQREAEASPSTSPSPAQGALF